MNVRVDLVSTLNFLQKIRTFHKKTIDFLAKVRKIKKNCIPALSRVVEGTAR